MNFFRMICVAAAVCVASQAVGQAFKGSGRKAAALAPDGWTVQESRGDLNRDGIADLVLLAFPNDPELMFFNDDGQWVDTNVPRLAVYWGSASGLYRLHRSYDYYGPLDAEAKHLIRAEITGRGTVRMMHVIDYPDNTQINVEIFRWQNGDFFRIGNSVEIYNAASDSSVVDSRNYSTLRHQHLEFKGHDADSPDRAEVWDDIPAQALVRLGNLMVD